jgi:hypothetical protein
MTRTFIHPVKLRKWFPPRDRFAACMARLCILREDLLLEMLGIYQRKIKPLDEHSVLWRQMFFWRSLVKTMWEMRQAIESLNTIPEFKRVLKRQPKSWQKKYLDMVKLLAKHQTLVGNIRNSLGGHVLSGTVEKALNEMSLDTEGFIEEGEVEKRTHYRFANDLVLEILLAGVEKDQRLDAIHKSFRTVADLMPVFELTGILLTIYADERGLLE